MSEPLSKFWNSVELSRQHLRAGDASAFAAHTKDMQFVDYLNELRIGGLQVLVGELIQHQQDNLAVNVIEQLVGDSTQLSALFLKALCGVRNVYDSQPVFELFLRLSTRTDMTDWLYGQALADELEACVDLADNTQALETIRRRVAWCPDHGLIISYVLDAANSWNYGANPGEEVRSKCRHVMGQLLQILLQSGVDLEADIPAHTLPSGDVYIGKSYGPHAHAFAGALDVACCIAGTIEPKVDMEILIDSLLDVGVDISTLKDKPAKMTTQCWAHIAQHPRVKAARLADIAHKHDRVAPKPGAL